MSSILFCADFSNVISKSEIKALAEADEQEVVAEVQVGEVWFIITWSLLLLMYVIHLKQC